MICILKKQKHINNWNPADLLASKIIDEYLRKRSHQNILVKLAHPKSFGREISIITTYQFIAFYKSEDTFKIAKILISGHHDLIQKAVGWMLREAGKGFLKRKKEFLDKKRKNCDRAFNGIFL